MKSPMLNLLTVPLPPTESRVLHRGAVHVVVLGSRCTRTLLEVEERRAKIYKILKIAKIQLRNEKRRGSRSEKR